MRIVIENFPCMHLGEQMINGQKRQYYQPCDYHLRHILLVCQGFKLNDLEMHGRQAILLINNRMIDSAIVCDLFPAAPDYWRDMKIVQASVKLAPGKGRIYRLYKALYRVPNPNEGR